MKYLVFFCALLSLVACSQSSPQPKPVEPKPQGQPQSKKIAASKTPTLPSNDKPSAPEIKQTTKTQRITLNGREVGKIEQAPAQTTMTWARGEDTLTFRFGDHVQHVNAVKIIDMNKSQTLHRDRASWSLKTNNIKNPALLIEVRQRFPPKKNDPRTLRKYRVRKFSHATRTRWMLLPLNQPTGFIWRETISDQHSDGFGGHTLANIKLVIEGKTRKITASRREQLPARRARCKRPAPYPVEYTQRDRRFVKTSGRPLKASPCGR